MHKYKHYQAIDFLCDDDFIEWVRAPRPESDLYWEGVFTHFPAIMEPAEEARQMLDRLYIKALKGQTAALQASILAKAFKTEGSRKDQSLRVLAKGMLYKWMVAALLLLLAGAVLFLRQLGRHTKLEIVEINHSNSQQVKNTDNKALLVCLPDQSTVILQPKAYIRYARDSFASKREVHLVGEAFFDVSKNERIPFVVQTDQLVTTVLGTSFFVKAEPRRANHQVRVATGAVRVRGKKSIGRVGPAGPKELVLHAGEEVLVQKDRPLGAVEAIAELKQDPEEREKIFDFQNTPMREVAKTLEVQYGVTVTIKNEVLAERTITAFLANVSLQEQLNLIAKAVEAQYELEDGIVLFSLNTNQE